MEKLEAVATLGQTELLKPARVRAALAANDRLKLYLSVLQAAHEHASGAEAPVLDLSREFAAAGVKAPWLAEIAANAFREGKRLHIADLPRLTELIAEDLRLMGRPVEGQGNLDARVEHWCGWLAQLEPDTLSSDDLRALTSGKRGRDDSLHLVVMDLHKAINHLAAELSSENIDGAHVWQIEDADRPRIVAFMRGLNQTRALKLQHPGLDTAATRDGDRLLLQNDIGTNDAHVLVIQVAGREVTLTYSDLHRRRFAFFQSLLCEVGASWSDPQARTSAGLNFGASYYVGTARFSASDESHLWTVLEGIGARIVFLIDWNRARKRLELFVSKTDSVAILSEAARRRVGHMAWLEAGGEKLVFDAMQALGADYFRIGDRLDVVMGTEKARAFVLDVMALALRELVGRHLETFQREAGEAFPQDAHEQLRQALLEATVRLERTFGDMQDFEFTVQQGQLHLLQTRKGKRTPLAAARIALDLLEEGVIDAQTAAERTRGLDARALVQRRIGTADGVLIEPIARAPSAASGIACGEIVLDETRARARRAAGARVVLVRHDAETRDIAALDLADGLLTSRGARTSHAAVVARQLGKVCLVGCEALHIDEAARTVQFGERVLPEGAVLTLDGNEGAIYAGATAVVETVPEALTARLDALHRKSVSAA